jgi:hypothetical protein
MVRQHTLLSLPSQNNFNVSTCEIYHISLGFSMKFRENGLFQKAFMNIFFTRCIIFRKAGVYLFIRIILLNTDLFFRTSCGF